MRYQHLRNTHRNMNGFRRTGPRRKGNATMARKKKSAKRKTKRKGKKSAKRNPATSRYNKKTGKWESTGYLPGKPKRKRKAAKKKATKKVAKKSSKAPRRKKGAKRNRVPLTAEQRKKLAKSDMKQSGVSSLDRKVKSQEKHIEKLEAAIFLGIDKYEDLKKKVQKCETQLEAAASAPKQGKKRKGKKSAAEKPAKPKKRKARAGTKSKGCKPFKGKRKKPVKCRQTPTETALDGCGLAALRHGLDPRETCGPGLPKPPGGKLAEARWAEENRPKRRRNFGVNSSLWGD